MRRPCALLLAGGLALLQQCQAQIMSVDLGHEFFKVALMRQGAPLEIVLNSHSKRKTTTAVSFFEATRIFGDDALVHLGKAPSKVPMFFHNLLGQNFTEEDIQPGGKWWSAFGLGDRFYSHKLAYEESRGVPTFLVTDKNATEGEEVLAHILSFARRMSEATAEGRPVRDLVVTVPSDATLRQRQAIVAAGEIAGMRVLTLVHEGSAFAVQRAVDFMPEKGASELALFYNLGSRKAEVSIVKFESRTAGMVAGKMAPVVTVLGSAMDFGIGGHMMDIKIAEAMLKKFQDKFPKLAAGILENPRALRKLLSQAQKTKAVLSSNKVAPFIVESLYEDTDFQATIKREEFEEMCQDMFSRLTDPIDRALKIANVTMADIQHVEVVGGAWRVPKVQQLLSEFAEKGNEKKLPLGQHLNGEEAAALGAALIAANASSSFRVKKIFFSDVTSHEYAVQVVSLNGKWEKNITKLYPVGTPLGGKKKLSFSQEEDFAIKLFEDGVLVSEYEVTGLVDLLAGKWKEYNLTGAPKISVSVPLEMSGIIEVKAPTATVEEVYFVNVTKSKKNATAAGNATKSKNTTKSENATDDDAAKEDATNETASDDAEDGENASDENATTASNESSKDDADVEVVWKEKKKKHEKKLTIKRTDYRPKPLSADSIADLRKKLEATAKREDEVAAVAGIKNELEAAIYSSRDKLDRDDIAQVSTEQQREEIRKLGTEYEEWIHEVGGNKADYEKRLSALQDLLGPIEERALELEARSDLPSLVKEGIEGAKKDQAQVEKSMPWVNASKVEAAAKKLTDFSDWWTKKLEQQEKLSLHEAPAFTKKEVMDKLGKVQKEFEKLKKIKKPKEPAAPKASKADKAGKASKADKADKAEDSDAKAAKAAEAAEADLPADVGAAEKELAQVREKKGEAVEKEDFDGAHTLKLREQALVKHIEKLKGQKSEL